MDISINQGTVIVQWGETWEECDNFQADEISRRKGKFHFEFMERMVISTYDYTDAIELGLNCMRKHGLKFVNKDDEKALKSIKEKEVNPDEGGFFVSFPLKK